MADIGPTGVDIAAAAEHMRRAVDQVLGHGDKGRFQKGNRCSRGKRPQATPDLRQALRRQMTPRAARSIAKRLIKVARTAENDETAVAAAELILEVFKPLPAPSTTAALCPESR